MKKLVSAVKSSPKLKQIVLRMMIPANDHKPRRWVRWLLNPFSHSRGRQSIVRWRARLDVFPFNGFTLGKRSLIEDFCVVNNGVGPVVIGDDTIIGIGSVIIGPVVIGNNVMLAQHVTVSGLNHGYQAIDQPPSRQKVVTRQTIIDDNVWIGANAVVVPGVHVGKHSVVGAGSVVTKNIAPYSVVVGNPAKVVKQYNERAGRWESVIPSK